MFISDRRLLLLEGDGTLLVVTDVILPEMKPAAVPNPKGFIPAFTSDANE